MSSACRPATSADEPRIIELLTRAFGAPPEASYLAPAVLRWKYWEPRPDWTAPRSLVIERDGRLAAHVGLWPIVVRRGDRLERGVQMLDWASDPGAPGAGVSLLQRLTKEFDFVYSIGGSEITTAILPKFGFKTIATALTVARPIRPWRQVLVHPGRDARLPARLARNVWWSMTPARGALAGWSLVESGDGTLAAFTAERDEGFAEYLLSCPIARCRGFHLVHQGQRRGFFVLAEIGGQARLAAAWLANHDVESWRATFRLAQLAALQHTGAYEFVARAAGQEVATAAEQTGLRVRKTSPVFLFRRGGATDPPPLFYQLADDDTVFLGGGSFDFLT